MLFPQQKERNMRIFFVIFVMIVKRNTVHHGTWKTIMYRVCQGLWPL